MGFLVDGCICVFLFVIGFFFTAVHVFFMRVSVGKAEGPRLGFLADVVDRGTWVAVAGTRKRSPW